MLETHPIELPLPVVWSPPGPFFVEQDFMDSGFDAVAVSEDLLTAARKASRMKREFRFTEIRIVGPKGAW